MAHPSGEPRPTDEDVDLTSAVEHAAPPIGLAPADHVIVTPAGRFSSVLRRWERSCRRSCATPTKVGHRRRGGYHPYEWQRHRITMVDARGGGRARIQHNLGAWPRSGMALITPRPTESSRYRQQFPHDRLPFPVSACRSLRGRGAAR
ncbi:JAB domain-containing protein [Sorangium sp. So ce429]